MKRQKAIGLAWLVILWLGTAQADSILGQFNWNSGPPYTTEGWTTSDGWVNLSNPGIGGIGGSGYLKISMPAPAPEMPGEGWWAFTYVSADSLFAGDWKDKFLQTQFFAPDIQPDYVQIRWSSNNDGAWWRATVFDSNVSTMPAGWNMLTSPTLTNWEDWDFGGGGENFLSDLQNIDWIGVYIRRNTGIPQDYGIDDFRLMIPEPSQTIMLAAALLAAVLALRRKQKAAVLARVA
jgi:hypothetical protein